MLCLVFFCFRFFFLLYTVFSFVPDFLSFRSLCASDRPLSGKQVRLNGSTRLGSIVLFVFASDGYIVKSRRGSMLRCMFLQTNRKRIFVFTVLHCPLPMWPGRLPHSEFASMKPHIFPRNMFLEIIVYWYRPISCTCLQLKHHHPMSCFLHHFGLPRSPPQERFVCSCVTNVSPIRG